MARLRVEEMELLQYEKAKIFVRKVPRNEGNNGHIQEAASTSSSAQAENKDDPEYQVTVSLIYLELLRAVSCK